MKAVKLQIRAPCLCHTPTIIVKVITAIIIAIVTIVVIVIKGNTHNSNSCNSNDKKKLHVHKISYSFLGILACFKPFEAN